MPPRAAARTARPRARAQPTQLWTASPSRDAAAREGLGGSTGLAAVGAALALVGLSAALVVSQAPKPAVVEFDGEHTLGYYLIAFSK